VGGGVKQVTIIVYRSKKSILKFLFCFFSPQIQIYANDRSINANIFFATADKYDTTVGLAFTGSICAIEERYRIAIVEWNQTDILAGEVSSIILGKVG
jgi:hypothetical protein